MHYSTYLKHAYINAIQLTRLRITLFPIFHPLCTLYPLYYIAQVKQTSGLLIKRIEIK